MISHCFDCIDRSVFFMRLPGRKFLPVGQWGRHTIVFRLECMLGRGKQGQRPLTGHTWIMGEHLSSVEISLVPRIAIVGAAGFEFHGSERTVLAYLPKMKEQIDINFRHVFFALILCAIRDGDIQCREVH